MTRNWTEKYRAAVTTKEITGRCIPTISVGTKFEVLVNGVAEDYAACRGLPITSIWNDEYVLMKD